MRALHRALAAWCVRCRVSGVGSRLLSGLVVCPSSGLGGASAVGSVSEV